MAFLGEIARHKLNITQTFLQDEELVSLITGDDSPALPAFGLQYKNVFPYDRKDDGAVEKTDVFLCTEFEVSSVRTIAVKNLTLWVWIFVPRARMHTPEGPLTDRIANRVDELLNGRTDFGFGKLSLESVSRVNPGPSFYGKALRYEFQDFNRAGARL